MPGDASGQFVKNSLVPACPYTVSALVERCDHSERPAFSHSGVCVVTNAVSVLVYTLHVVFELVP